MKMGATSVTRNDWVRPSIRKMVLNAVDDLALATRGMFALAVEAALFNIPLQTKIFWQLEGPKDGLFVLATPLCRSGSCRPIANGFRALFLLRCAAVFLAAPS